MAKGRSPRVLLALVIALGLAGGAGAEPAAVPDGHASEAKAATDAYVAAMVGDGQGGHVGTLLADWTAAVHDAADILLFCDGEVDPLCDDAVTIPFSSLDAMFEALGTHGSAVVTASGAYAVAMLQAAEGAL